MSYGEGEEYSARELDPGEHGELWLRSPSCIAAYYRNDEATAEAFRGDGWYRTGDIGFFKDEKLFLVDRKKVSIDHLQQQFLSCSFSTGYSQDSGQHSSDVH